MLTSSLLALVVLLTAAALIYLYGLARRRAARMQALIARVGHRFGFRNNSPGGVTPNLFGEIEG